jgi:hypothetical protein
MRKNTALFVLLASAIFLTVGFVILWILTAGGTFALEGVALGAGIGLWLSLGLLVGRAIYGRRSNVIGLALFMVAAVIAGLVYQFVWLLPYMSANRTLTGLAELFGGMGWALSFAALYLSIEDFRRAANGYGLGQKTP